MRAHTQNDFFRVFEHDCGGKDWVVKRDVPKQLLVFDCQCGYSADVQASVIRARRMGKWTEYLVDEVGRKRLIAILNGLLVVHEERAMR